MARELASKLGAPLVVSDVSRLLVDLNRSIGNPRLHCDAIWNASAQQRRGILERYYIPYRTEVERRVVDAIENGTGVVHVSSHSFTPELDGHLRNADIGLLYDPSRKGELELCKLWKGSLAACGPKLKVRRNYPYAGKGDGLTRYLRERFAPTDYVGIELEINQRYVFEAGTPLGGAAESGDPLVTPGAYNLAGTSLCIGHCRPSRQLWSYTQHDVA